MIRTGGKALGFRPVAALVTAAVAATLLIAHPPRSHADTTDVHLAQKWLRYGTGMVADLAVGDVDDDGVGEAVVGGRGVGVIDHNSLEDGEFSWVNKWVDASGHPMVSDAETVQEFKLTDLTGDGALDAVVGTDSALFAMDGGDGHTLWTVKDASSGTAYGAHEVALGDMTADGVDDIAFSELLDERITAVDGKDGSRLWIYPHPVGFVLDMASGDLNGDGFSDVVVVGYGDVGLEVHAISGAAVGADGVAPPLWVQKFPAPPVIGQGRPGSVAIAQILPGLAPEVAVGGFGALSVLDGLSGVPRAQRALGNAAANDVKTVQLDADPELEIAAAGANFEGDPVHSVQVYQSDLTPIGAVDVPAPIGEIATTDLDGDGQPEIVAGGGWQRLGGIDPQDGYVVSLDVPSDGSSPTQEWMARLPEDVDSLAVGEVFGQKTILAGQLAALGGGGGVYALDPAGSTRWFFRTGGRVEDLAVSDIDGDGSPEVVESGSDTRVSVSSADGTLWWERRVPGQGSPSVTAVSAGNLEDAPGQEIVAGTFEFFLEGPPGRLHSYSSSGELLWSRDIAGNVDDLAVTDVDDDGAGDVMMVASAPGLNDPTGVAGRYGAGGKVIWERRVPTGQATSLSLMDVNNDGVEDSVVTRNSVYHGGAVFVLDGATGADLWKFDLPDSVLWTSVTGKIADGITAGDLRGHVFRLAAADGVPIWDVDPGNASWGGQWSIDANGDGTLDVLSASNDNAVRMLSGSNGAELWNAPTEGTPGYKVATLQGKTPVVAVGELGQATYAPAHVLLLDAMTGDRLGLEPTNGPVLDVAPANLDSDGADEFVAAAGWQVVAFDALGNEPPDMPDPTKLAFTMVSRVTGQFSDKTRLEAALTDDSGHPLPNAQVDFELHGHGVSRHFHATTGTDGVAAVTPKLQEKPGAFKVTVRFAGTSTDAPSEVTGDFAIRRENTRLDLDVTKDGNRRTLTAHLIDADSRDGIVGRRIEFLLGEKLLGRPTTNSAGRARIDYRPVRSGLLHYRAHFGGSDYFKSSADRNKA